MRTIHEDNNSSGNGFGWIGHNTPLIPGGLPIGSRQLLDLPPADRRWRPAGLYKDILINALGSAANGLRGSDNEQ
jgi:hypothetical protein